MKTKLLTITFLFFSTLVINAGNEITGSNKAGILAEIVLKDGNMISASIDMPKLKDKELNYIDPLTGKRQYIDCSEIKYMTVWHSDFPNLKYVFIYTLVKEYSAGLKKERLAKKPVWLLLEDQRKHIRLFRSGDQYKFSKKDGTLRIIANGHHGQPTAPLYYLQRIEEEIPTEVGTYSYAETFMKSYGKFYFSNCPQMLETIEKRTFRDLKISAILDYYDEIAEL